MAQGMRLPWHGRRSWRAIYPMSVFSTVIRRTFRFRRLSRWPWHVLMRGQPWACSPLELNEPFGYGRVIRSEDGGVVRVVEEKDFDPVEHGGEVYEVNSGVYVFDVRACSRLLSRMDQDNAQGEFYLTQMISLCAQEGLPIVGMPFGNSDLLRGINSPKELIRLRRP